MKTKVTILGIALLAVIFNACTKDALVENVATANDKAVELEAAKGESCTYSDEITEVDMAGLIAMREEEKLAQDVYLTFFEMYGQTIFQNIASSEASHTEAVLSLLTGYGIDDPALEGIGNFSNPDFTTLFKTLTDQGSDVVEALKTGAYIEELDILDLQEWIESTENSDIERVYTNLLKGSENHLRAFVKALVAQGVEYVPQLLSDEAYENLINGENTQKGQGSQGNGQKNQDQSQDQCTLTGTGTNGQSQGQQGGNSGNTGKKNGNNGQVNQTSGNQDGTQTGTNPQDGTGQKKGSSNGNGDMVMDGSESGSTTQTQSGGNSDAGNSNGNGNGN